MKFINHHGEDVEIRWSDHRPGCAKCREVEIDSSATFSRSCAQGGVLLMEELKKRQAPVERAQRRAVEKWAEEAGTFIKSRATNVAMKYK